MRDIKFRAWDKKKKIMRTGVDLKSFIGGGPARACHATPNSFLVFYSEPEDEVLMQYTGLKDKNGKEIYEGDIVERNGHLYVIKYQEAAFIISVPKREISSEELVERYLKGSAAMFYYNDLTVTGNLYENPEIIQEHGTVQH